MTAPDGDSCRTGHDSQPFLPPSVPLTLAAGLSLLLHRWGQDLRSASDLPLGNTAIGNSQTGSGLEMQGWVRECSGFWLFLWPNPLRENKYNFHYMAIQKRGILWGGIDNILSKNKKIYKTIHNLCCQIPKWWINFCCCLGIIFRELIKSVTH